VAQGGGGGRGAGDGEGARGAAGDDRGGAGRADEDGQGPARLAYGARGAHRGEERDAFPHRLPESGAGAAAAVPGVAYGGGMGGDAEEDVRPPRRGVGQGQEMRRTAR